MYCQNNPISVIKATGENKKGSQIGSPFQKVLELPRIYLTMIILLVLFKIVLPEISLIRVEKKYTPLATLLPL